MDELEDLVREAARIREHADLLYGPAQVDQAVVGMAHAITGTLHDKHPVLLCLMLGGVVVTGRLLQLLSFPLQLDYVHATRYRGATTGGELDWLRRPALDLAGRTVLIVDDILDEGYTLAAMVAYCRDTGAADVRTAVLADKQIGRAREIPRADFTGLTVPDRYVFGYGMDYKGLLRNCNGIYAVRD